LNNSRLYTYDEVRYNARFFPWTPTMALQWSRSVQWFPHDSTFKEIVEMCLFPHTFDRHH